MTTKAELIAEQLVNGEINRRTWGEVLYIATAYGVVGGGVTDDTAAVQALVDKAIADGRKLIFFPHGTYKVTALTNADQVVFVGDNASFTGGYAGTIEQLGYLGNVLKKGDVFYTAKDYGAKGDGFTDDSTALKNFLTACDTDKVKGYIPKGTYLINAPVSCVFKNSLYVELHPEAVIKAAPGFPSDRLLHMEADPSITTKRDLFWFGGQLHGQNIPPSGAGEANDLMGLYGHDLINKATVSDVYFTLKPDYTDADGYETVTAGDSHLFISAVDNALVRRCRFAFAVDAAIYISALQTSTASEFAMVEDCTFYECNVAIISKRSHKKYIAKNNRITRCNNGISQGEADGSTTNVGVEVMITDNFLERCNRSIELRKQVGSIVRGNRIKQIGKKSDAVSPVGILVTGSKNCIVEANILDGADTLGTGVRAIIFNDRDGITHENNHLKNNVFKDFANIPVEQSTSAMIYVGGNSFPGCAATFTSANGMWGDVAFNGSYFVYENGKQRQLQETYQTNIVKTLTGGATTETVNFTLPAGRFTVKPKVGIIQAATGLANQMLCMYDHDNASTTATNAVVQVYTANGSVLPAGNVRFVLYFSEENL